MKIFQFVLAGLVLFSTSCKHSTKEKEESGILTENGIEVQGHRGERGLMPENSIPGFIAAINDSVDVIEMDVVISGDGEVVVSHEPFMSSAYVLQPNGDSIKKSEEANYNLYQMPYDSIRKYDIGLKGNNSFPGQHKVSAYKPLLVEVIDSVEKYIENKKLKPVGYNIELKSDQEQYGISQPEPEVFVDMVMNVIENKDIKGAVNIQSFDPAILNTIHKNYPGTKLAFLVYKEGIQENMDQLNFVPEIYSPNYNLVKNEAFVDSIKALQMKLIPWTVNKNEAIKKMIELRVDGIITDFPGKANKLFKAK
ncbi:glycerophosphodiester phosphodiesterase family protein [Zunongwangia sp. H14]|uniref:glycerophosphodiester phosphodiesterase family protein n=1 Tax=Zunongwangia sp. H14 TaxID=3240792 RepID=UPI003561B435